MLLKAGRLVGRLICSLQAQPQLSLPSFGLSIQPSSLPHIAQLEEVHVGRFVGRQVQQRSTRPASSSGTANPVDER